jgi:hypothetical protein
MAPHRQGQTFELHRGAQLLGTIELRAELCDFPWYGGRFTAGPAFETVAHLFRQELELLGAEEMDAWGRVKAEIDGPGLRLMPAGGGPPEPDFMLHIEGDEARWRC